MKSTRVRKNVDDEPMIAPVTILDAAGRVVRIVSAKEFQQAAAAAREAAASETPDGAEVPVRRLARPLR